MRIWIISSDPFFDEFKKIATKWPEADEITLTPITKFGIGFRSFLAFYREYKRIKPERILTDVGYLGLYFIIIINRFLRRNLKTTFYLRGNYWLEEREHNVG